MDGQPHRCPTCGDPITEYGKIMVLTREMVMEHYRFAPPRGRIPEGAGVSWRVYPCGCEVTLVQLREMGVEPETYEHPPA